MEFVSETMLLLVTPFLFLNELPNLRLVCQGFRRILSGTIAGKYTLSHQTALVFPAQWEYAREMARPWKTRIKHRGETSNHIHTEAKQEGESLNFFKTIQRLDPHHVGLKHATLRLRDHAVAGMYAIRSFKTLLTIAAGSLQTLDIIDEIALSGLEGEALSCEFPCLRQLRVWNHLPHFYRKASQESGFSQRYGLLADCRFPRCEVLMWDAAVEDAEELIKAMPCLSDLTWNMYYPQQLIDLLRSLAAFNCAPSRLTTRCAYLSSSDEEAWDIATNQHTGSPFVLASVRDWCFSAVRCPADSLRTITKMCAYAARVCPNAQFSFEGVLSCCITFSPTGHPVLSTNETDLAIFGQRSGWLDTWVGRPDWEEAAFTWSEQGERRVLTLSCRASLAHADAVKFYAHSLGFKDASVPTLVLSDPIHPQRTETNSWFLDSLRNIKQLVVSLHYAVGCVEDCGKLRNLHGVSDLKALSDSNVVGVQLRIFPCNQHPGWRASEIGEVTRHVQAKVRVLRLVEDRSEMEDSPECKPSIVYDRSAADVAAILRQCSGIQVVEYRCFHMFQWEAETGLVDPIPCTVAEALHQFIRVYRTDIPRIGDPPTQRRPRFYGRHMATTVVLRRQSFVSL